MSNVDNFKLDPGLQGPARGMRRKRFLVLSVAALAVLAVAMGVSFLGATGSASLEVSSGSSNFVFPVGKSGITGTPPAAAKELKWKSTSETGKLPGWSPTVNTAGEVATAGDIALIDATTTPLLVNVFVTNLANLQVDYSSFALPMHVYEATCAAKSGEYCGETGHTWTENTELSKEYLTNTEGNLSFSLPAGKYYDIAIDTGGSYYTIGTTEGDLSPAFYFTAQAT